MRFWTPKFSLSFSWPRAHVSFPSQFGLGLSLAVFSMEYILMLGQLLMRYAYPKGYAFDDMYSKRLGEKEAVQQRRTYPELVVEEPTATKTNSTLMVL